MNVSINILFVAHLQRNVPQLLSQKIFRQFFHMPLTGLHWETAAFCYRLGIICSILWTLLTLISIFCYFFCWLRRQFDRFCELLNLEFLSHYERAHIFHTNSLKSLQKPSFNTLPQSLGFFFFCVSNWENQNEMWEVFHYKILLDFLRWKLCPRELLCVNCEHCWMYREGECNRGKSST